MWYSCAQYSTDSMRYRRAMGRSEANSLPQPLPLEKLPSGFCRK